MTIGEFLNHVRRFVVDFVVGRVLSRDNADGASAAAESLDELTAYYLLHRHDFGLEPAPIGQVILYGQSCGLSDRAWSKPGTCSPARKPPLPNPPRTRTPPKTRPKAPLRWRHRQAQSLESAQGKEPGLWKLPAGSPCR